MSRRPLIAFFAPIAPYPTPLNGGQLRVDRLVAGLIEDFDIVFICQTPVPAEELSAGWRFGQRVRRIITAPAPGVLPTDGHWGSVSSSIVATLQTALPGRPPRVFDWSWSRPLIDESRKLFSELRFDAVWASRTWMAEMARAAGATKVLVDVDDFQGKLRLDEFGRAGFYARKPLHWIQLHHLKRYERRLLTRFPAVAAVKPDDLSLLDDASSPRVHVIPNGVDIPAKVCRGDGSSDLLFVGDLSYEPNVEALADLATVIFPAIQSAKPDARLIVAGRKPLAEKLVGLLNRPGIVVHESPASLDEFYARAALFVAPLSIGGGTSIKVLESLAYALPTVASSVAARGLGLRHGEHLLIADSPAASIEACLDLLRNRDRATLMGARGRDEVSRRFSWQSIGAIARSAVHQLVDDG